MGRRPHGLRVCLLAGTVGLIVAVSGLASGAALPTVTYEGRSYVELFRIAERLRARLEATPEGPQARLTTSEHVVTVTRNWTRALVDGTPVPLDAPVRVKGNTWLVPETFVARVLPMITGTSERPAEVDRPSGNEKAAAEKPTNEKSNVPAPAAPKSSGAALEDLRFRSYPSFTRVVLEMSAGAVHRLESGGAREARVRVSGLRAEPQAVEIRDGLVAEVRLERAGADAMLRVVFEGPAAELKASTLADPYRLVLDFNRPPDTKARDGRAAFSPLRTIVLDAGHGGHDTGAVGPGGLYEKDLVLDVTLRVARLVEERLGVRVLLTRDSDVFVTLRDRTSFANKEGADLFVSIHANAHHTAASTGVETFFLSSEATDSAARQVAAQENQVVQLERPAARGRSNDIVKTILWDLAQSEFQVESSRLAEIVQDSMTQSLKIPNRGVKQAGFYVLGGAAMPAVLLEIGFVTNPREERRLKESRYRDEIARAIFAGLAEYKRDHDQRTRAAAR